MKHLQQNALLFSPFQIVYKDGLLYVYASNEDSRSQWLKALKKGKKTP